jgi:hypothetical protein
MRQVKEIKQLKKRERTLENISYLKGENVKRHAGPYMLALAGLTSIVAAGVLTSMFRKSKDVN